MGHHIGSAVLRSAWVQALARETQVFVGAAADAPISTLPALVERLVETLSQPLNPAECFAARAIVLDGAVDAGSMLHHRAHGRARHRCEFNPTEAAVGVWHRHPFAPASFLQEWAARVWTELGRDQEILWQAQSWAARQWRESRSSSDVADALGMRAAAIDRVFQRTLGMSFSKYHRGVRLATAIELLATTDLKVDAVALEVGFRSKKNFYRAFYQWMGVTPRQFRANGLRLRDGWIEQVPSIFRREVRAATQLRPWRQRTIDLLDQDVRATRGVRLRV